MPKHATWTRHPRKGRPGIGEQSQRVHVLLTEAQVRDLDHLAAIMDSGTPPTRSELIRTALDEYLHAQLPR